MADVSPVGVQDFGNLMTSFGQGIANTNLANANTANTNASTGLVNQQAQGAQLSNQSQAMQNQIMQARLPIILKALGDYRQQSDDSGEEAEGGNGSKVQATPATDGKALPKDPTNPTAGSNGVPNQPAEEPTEDNIFDTNRIIGGLKQAYYVNPAGTAQEIAAIKNAAIADPDGKLGILEQAKQMRQLNVDNRVAQSQSKAGELYDAMDKGVLNAPKGRALDALDTVSQGVAERIRKMLPDEMDEDKAARKYAEMIANEVHQYTGRPVEKGPDNVYRDSKTLRPLVGADRVGMTQEQITKLATDLATPVDRVDSNGNHSQVPKYQLMYPGLSYNQAVTKAMDAMNVPGASPSVTGAPRAETQSRVRTAVDQVSKNPPPPAAPAAPPAAPPRPGQPPPGSPQAGAAALKSQLVLQPDGTPVDIDKMPVANLPPVTPNSSGGTEEKAQRDAYTDAYKQVYSDANRKIAESNQTDALITPFQQKLNSINPRDVGPGSEIYKSFLQFKDAIFKDANDPGKQNDLVDMGVIDKFANQLGVANVRNLLSGQKITNQEMMNFLTRASASTTQPIDVMKTIVSYQKANNDFDRRWATTALAALAKHRDPAAVNALENYRPAYVAASMKRDGFDTGPAAAPAAKPMPSDAILTNYAKEHKLPGGLDQARAIMKKRGYQ